MNIVVFTKNWLGDVIFEEPFIRNLKKIYPDAKIIAVTNQRTKSILEVNPNIYKVITYDDRNKDKNIFAFFKLILLLRKNDIDIGFLLHRSFSRALLLKFSGVKKIYGYPTKRRGWLLSSRIQEPKNKLHRIYYFLNILILNNLLSDNEPETYRFYYSVEDEIKANEILKKNNINKNFICINLGANWEKKRWPVKYFASLINLIQDRYKIDIVITGALKDMQLAGECLNYIGNRNAIKNLCGQTSVRELGAVFAKAELLISADSGPLHIASGVGTTVIAIFGPTDSIETSPNGPADNYILQKLPRNCITPCFNDSCKNNKCMQNVSPQDIITLLDEKRLLSYL